MKLRAKDPINTHTYTQWHTQRAFRASHTPRMPQKLNQHPKKAITDALHNLDALKAK